MFGKKKRKGRGTNGSLLTIMGGAAKIEGKLAIDESIQIECEVAGEVQVDGKLVIGENGVVKADVHTVDAIIMGRYEGSMVATGHVQIAATGRVDGNIETDSLVIFEGGFFNGQVIKMQRKLDIVSDHRSAEGVQPEQKYAALKPA